MFSLRLYMRNSLSGSPTEYTIDNLYPQDFYIGRKRDPKNLLIIRKFTEGVFIVSDADFDAISDFIFSPQDGLFYIDGNSNQCHVKFTEPNYTTKKIKLHIDLIDEYSNIFDGVKWDNWGSENIPTISKTYLKSELDAIQVGDMTEYFADGSQYRYDAESLGSELWGIETEIFTESKDVYIADTLLFNIGGDSTGSGEITIGMLLPKLEYLEQYYKPTFVYWYNSSGSFFQTVQVYYSREFRYFTELEKIPDGWEPVTGTRTKNGFTYNKYARPLYGNQTYLSGSDIYHIRDEGSSYVTAQFGGMNTELQKSDKFYNLNDMLNRLIDLCDNRFKTYTSSIPNDLYTCILNNYNGSYGFDKFKLDQFINTLRDKFSIYFSYEDNNAVFKELDFNTELLDVEDYRGHNFLPYIQVGLNEISRVYEVNTEAGQLDFMSQIVSFYGKSNIKDSVSYEVITDLENTNKKDDQFVLMKTNENFHDQIYERGRFVGENNGTEAIHLTPDGKYIWWDAAELDLSTDIVFTLYSNKIYLDIDDNIQFSYGVVIYTGQVTIKIGNYTGTHTSSTTVSSSTTLAGSRIEYAQIIVTDPIGTFRGFVYDFTVKTKTLIPEITTGKISGRALKNGKLSTANTIIDNKPLMSYQNGNLSNYGTIDCNVKYVKELDLKIALNYSIFDYDMNDYISLDGEKYIIFEEKRQILTQEKTSEITKIKALSNEVY